MSSEPAPPVAANELEFARECVRSARTHLYVSEHCSKDGHYGAARSHSIMSREELAKGLAHLFVHLEWARFEGSWKHRKLALRPRDLNQVFDLGDHVEKGALGQGAAAFAFLLEFAAAVLPTNGDRSGELETPSSGPLPTPEESWSALSPEVQATTRAMLENMRMHAEAEARQLAGFRERGLYVDRFPDGRTQSPLQVTLEQFEEIHASAVRDFEQLSRYIEEDPGEVLWRRALFRRFVLASLSEGASPSGGERGSS